LGFAGLHFVIAYQNMDASKMLSRTPVVAWVEVVLGAWPFAPLGRKRRSLLAAGFMVFARSKAVE